MKVVLISVLLFFEICSGFSVQKVQRKRSAETDIGTPGQTDVYEVKEGEASTVTLTHPKPEKPTLREIIYYHLIEYPYEDQGAKKADHTDAVISDDGDNARDDYADQIPHRNEEVDEDDDVGGQDEEGQSPENTDQAEGMELDVRNRNGQASTAENVKEYDQKKSADKKNHARNVLFDQAKTKYVERRQAKPSPRRKREISNKDLPPAPILPPLNLGALPEYIRRLISTPESQPKTPLKDSLTHFDEEDFSEELQKKIDDMISSLKPEDDEDKNHTDEDDDDDDDNDTEDDNDTQDDTDDYWEESEDENDGHDDQKDSRNHVEAEHTTNKRIPRTFGMNLTMGRGYVWNDLLSEPGVPGMSFDVGESEDDTENTRDEVTNLPVTTKNTEKPTTTEQPVTTAKPAEAKEPIDNKNTPNEPFTNDPHSTEDKPVHSEDTNSDHALHYVTSNDKNADGDNKGAEKETSNDDDLEDINVTNFKPKIIHSNGNSEEKDEHIRDKNDKESKPINSNVSKNREYEAEKLEPTNENISNHATNHKKYKHKHKPIFKPENDDSLKELMKNEQFWKWLNDWTSTYMELLMKHIKGLVHDEVSRQIKALALDLKKDTLEGNNEQNTKQKEDKTVTLNSNSDQTKNDTNLVIHDDDQLIVDKKDDSSSENNTLVHDDKRFLIHGKIPLLDNDMLAMPFEHTTNFDLNKENLDNNFTNDLFKEESNDLSDFLRQRKHKNDNENRKKPNSVNNSNKGSNDKSPIRISATNIFGNAAGSDKVTNIFVFYPSNDEGDDKNDASILSSITPSITEMNNIFVSGKRDKVKIDKRVPEISKQKDESLMSVSNATEKPNDIINPSIILESDKDTKEGITDQEFQKDPTTTTPKDNVDKAQNASEKVEQTDKPKTELEQNNTNQSNVDSKGGLGNDDKMGPTTESTTDIVSPLTDKEQKDIKPINSENNDTNEVKVESKTDLKTDAESPATDKIIDSKTEITTEHSEKLEAEEVKELEAKVEKEIEAKVEKKLEEKITKELEAMIEKELQKRIGQELSKAIERELIKTQNKEIDITAAISDKKDQQLEHKENISTENPEKLIEEQKELEAKVEKELHKTIKQEISKEIEKELIKAQNEKIDEDMKPDKETDKVFS